MRGRIPLLPFVLALLVLTGCRDVSRFSSRNGSFEGPVVAGSFVRAGIADDARMCLTFDADRMKDAPGAVSTTDGRFAHTLLRPVPQIWHDPLSTMSFGEGRVQNLVYAATPLDGGTDDVFVVVSLMQSGGIEVRVLRGAPEEDAAAAPAHLKSPPLFGIFTLDRRDDTPCP